MVFISNCIQIRYIPRTIKYDNIEFIYYILKQCDVIYKPFVTIIVT
jgi:hypothetical protein